MLLQAVVGRRVLVARVLYRHRSREVGVEVALQLVRQDALVVGASLRHKLPAELLAPRCREDVAVSAGDHCVAAVLHAGRQQPLVGPRASSHLGVQEAQQRTRLSADTAS